MSAKLSLALVVALAACGTAQAPAPEPAVAPVSEPIAAAPAPAQPPVVAEPALSPAPEAVTGIAACDEYLAAYKRCEKSLEAAIAAGNARAYRSEAAWLQYMKGTPEAASMPEACRSSLQALRDKCAL